MSRAVALILMYHRIDDAVSDPWSLCVGPDRFAEHLQVLNGGAWKAESLTTLCQALETGVRLDRSVVVTFDDGYADNLAQAAPLLQRYQVPATIFLVSGDLDAVAGRFWWDELERLILGPGRLPAVVRLRVHGGAYEWEIRGWETYDADDAERYRDWRAWEEPPTPRHRAYRSLWDLLQSLDATTRRGVLDELAAMSEPGPAATAPRRLRAGEIRTLAAHDQITIGAHTVTHPSLAALPFDRQREEIAGSRARLRELLGTSVDSFAFPFGAECNYTAETVGLVRDAGFRAACTTAARVVRSDADLFRLPRFQVENWTADEFAQRLASWLAAPIV